MTSPHHSRAGQYLAQNCDVRGRRATASTDDACALGDHCCAHLGKEFGREVIDIAAMKIAWNARIGIDGEGSLGRRKLLDEPKGDLRSIHAIDANDLGVMLRQLCKSIAHRRAIRE